METTAAPASANTSDTDREDNDTLSVAEAAALLSVSERTARRYAATAKLDAERVTAPDGRSEWRIYRRSVTHFPTAANRDRAVTGRKAADTVPLEMYRETQHRLEAALLQVGQLTEVRSRLLLTEQTESTLREHLHEAQTRINELEAQITPKRRWFSGRARNATR
jgi:excisionase family DNA binding protein